jgi:hypothetical protein
LSSSATEFYFSGTVLNDIPYLLQLNDAIFPSATVRLSKNVQIYRTLPEHIIEPISEFIATFAFSITPTVD